MELSNTLLNRNLDQPLWALWEALADRTYSPDIALSIAKDSRCGIDRVASSDEEVLLEASERIQVFGGGLLNPLRLAVASHRLDAISLLLANGASVASAIHQLSQVSAEEYRLLIDNGADVDCLGTFQNTQLQEAARRTDLKTVELLLAEGADASAKDQFGGTALVYFDASFNHMSRSEVAYMRSLLLP